MDHARVQTNGVSLHVVTDGPREGPLVILLHGFPDFWFGWRNYVEPLAAKGLRVLVPDQRGYNESDKPKGVAAYWFDELAKDVVGLIDASGREKASIVGHDWGAAVAWWTAMKYPERVERIVTLNVPHPFVMRKFLLGDFTQLKKSWYMFFFQLPIWPERVFQREDGRRMAEMLRESAKPGVFTDDVLERYRAAWRQPGALTAMLNWYRASVRKAAAPRREDPRIKPPVLLIWGEQDPQLGIEMGPPSMELCARGRFERIENAGHWPQHDQPERVMALLIDFLTS